MPVGRSVITFQLQDGSLVKINVLVAQEKPLVFDLQVGMNAIKELGTVEITSSDAVEFKDRKTISVCSSHHRGTEL